MHYSRARIQIVFLGLFAAQLRAEIKLKVHLDRVLQSDYLGVNQVYHGFAFMPEAQARGMNDADRAREFDRVSEMRLNLARTWFRPDWSNGDSLGNAPDWESPKMRAFYKWLAEMRARNVDVAMQAGWWFTTSTPMKTMAWFAPPSRKRMRWARSNWRFTSKSGP